MGKKGGKEGRYILYIYQILTRNSDEIYNDSFMAYNSKKSELSTIKKSSYQQ